MINNAEKELLLKLLMEKATKTDTINLQLIKTDKPKKRSKGSGRRPKGVRVWTIEENNFLKEAVIAGKTHREIAAILDRTVKSVETRLWLIRKGRVA